MRPPAVVRAEASGKGRAPLFLLALGLGEAEVARTPQGGWYRADRPVLGDHGRPGTPVVPPADRTVEHRTVLLDPGVVKPG